MYNNTKHTPSSVASGGNVQRAPTSAASPSHASVTAAAPTVNPSSSSASNAAAAHPTTSAAAPSVAASSPTVPRHITTELHCQAVVVRVGEQFGEFECEVFRHTRTQELSAQKALMASLKNGPSSATPSTAAEAVNADQQGDVPPLPTSSPTTAAAANAYVDDLSDLVPVDCTDEDVPRWQLLIYTILHNGQGMSRVASSRHKPLPTTNSTNTITTDGTTRSAMTNTNTAAGHHTTRDAASHNGNGGGGEAREPASLDELPLPENAKVCFFQTLPTGKLSKVVKLDPGCRFTVQVRCYARATAQWSPWSEPVQTATQFPVVTRIVEIGSDYVHCTWDRAAQRSEEGIAKEVDTQTTDWCRSIPNFELRFLRESDMAEHYFGSFEAGCRSQTVRALQPGTAYIVLMRYMTMIHTMREWTEVTRLMTESPLEVRLVARGEDTFTFSWGRSTPAAKLATPSTEPSAAAFLEDGGDATAAATASVAGYLLPRVPVHEYELIIESADLRFDPITVPASVGSHTMDHVYPSTSYAVSVRALSEEGRWGGRSLPLVVRTADRPTVTVAAVGESFASFAWSRKQEEALESQLQYRVQSLTSPYNQAETITLASAGDAAAPVARLLNVEHLRAGSPYTITLRVAIGAAWGAWTEPLRFTTAPSAALTFLERGEDFLTLNWPSTGLAISNAAADDDAQMIPHNTAAPSSNAANNTNSNSSSIAQPVYNIVVVKCGSLGERTAVLNERVTRDPTQRGFRVSDLEANTTYDVQCRTWQRNPMTGFEGWGEFSAPVRMQTLQPVALHVWDVGEDFIHVVWRRGLSEQNEGGASGSDSQKVATADWDRLKYEVVVGCVNTGEDALLHRQVLDTSFTISQLKPSTTYTISVRACDEQGQWGLWSSVKVLTLASVKTTLNEIGEDFVRLVWQRCGADDNADLHDVTVADMFVAKYSVLVYAKELPGMPVVAHGPSGYAEGGGRSDVVRHEVVSSEHTSLRVGDLLPDREYVAVVRAATSSGRWGLWSKPIRFRTNAQFRIPAQQLTIGENYVSVVWSRGEERATGQQQQQQQPSQQQHDLKGGLDADDSEVLRGDLTVTGQELRIHGVTTQYVKEYTLEPDVRELKMSELLPACAYTIQIRVRGRSGCWGLWSSPVHILTRGTIAVTTDEVAEDFIAVRWERRKVSNPHQYPTGRGIVTSYHLRVYNGDGVHMETFLGDGDCPYRVTGLKANTYYCVELKANYNDEEWGLWSVPLWCLTMQPMRIQTKLISEEFCCLQLARPNQQRRLPEDDGNPPTEERVLAHGRVRPTIMLCVTSPILSKTPYNTTSSSAAATSTAKPAYLNDALPPDAADQRLVYQTELLNSAETVEHTVPNLKCNTVYSVSVRTKLANGEWGMWSPSLVFATVPATRVSFTKIGESFVGVEWVRHAQVIPPQIGAPDRVVRGVATITASRVRVRESGGAYQHTYTVEGATTSLRVDHLAPATTYMVCVQTFNDNYEWGVWSEEQKVRTVPGMDIHIQHVSEDALWASWSRKTDLHVGGDADTVFNVNISARAFEVCILGEGGFTYTQETTSTALFFRGLLPDAVYTVHVRALFGQSDQWGLWSTQAFRTKPRLRVTFGNIGDHFVMLEWRRHLPKPTETELRLTAGEADGDDTRDDEWGQTGSLLDTSARSGGSAGVADGVGSAESGALVPVGGIEGLPPPRTSTTPPPNSRNRASTGANTAVLASPPLSIAETEDVVQLYRFKVQRIGEAHAAIYNIAPTVSSFRLRDLQPSSEYRVWVCAKGYEGVWGFWSEESRVRTLPRLQLEVQNIGEDYVRATWKRGAWDGASMAVEGGTEVRQVDGAVSGYEVRVLNTDGTVAATTTTTFRDAGITLAGLQLSSLYSIQVRAKDTYDAWGLWSDPVSFFTLKPVVVDLQRVGENFAAVHWSRHTPPHGRRRSTDADNDAKAALAATATASQSHGGGEDGGMYADATGVLHPDERVTRWHMRVSCNRVFAGMPQSEDYRELYVGEGESALQIDGLLPHATYAITVRGLNHAGEWGHWSPPLYVSTCPLLKVGVEMAGETYLQVAWQRPTARTGVTEWAAPQEAAGGVGGGRERSPHASTSVTHDYYNNTTNLNDLSHHNNNTLSMPISEGNSHSHTRPLVSGVSALRDDDNTEDDGYPDNSLSGSLSSAVPESYLCFPSESEVHNYQVTIRPMPTEPAFDESDEPLVDGARVYETTQPSLRLGNLLPGCRYAVTVREQQVSEEGRPIAGVWGAPSEVVCTMTVPPVHVIPQEIGEDYCLVEWRRAVVADAPEESSTMNANKNKNSTNATGDTNSKTGSPMTTVLAAATTAGRKAIEFQLQTRRLNPDGVTLYEGPLSLDSVVTVPSSVNTYHIPSLVPSSVYEVRVRAKMEGGQWGIWSLATRFLTQSRLELRVDMVQETGARLTWSRAKASVMEGSGSSADGDTHDGAEGHEADKPLPGGPPECDTASDAVGKSVTISTTAPPEIAVAAHVILPNDAVHAYEVVLEGISCEHQRRLQFSQDTQTAFVEDLQQDHLYCVSVRSLSEQQHWSYFSPKVTLLTLSTVQVRVAQYTEATALLEWDRPLPDVERFAELLHNKQREALQQCDERERRELFEMKRKIQEQESKGESGGMARWVDSAAREEHNALLREEATLHYQMDRIVVGNAESTGFELRVTLQDGAVCLPFIAGVDRLRLRSSKVSRIGSTRDLLGSSRRPGPGTSTSRGFFNSVIGGASGGVSTRDRKKEVTLKTSVTLSNISGSPSSAAASGAAGAGPVDGAASAVELLDVQLQSGVTQVLLQGLSPNSTFAASVRGRSGPEAWQPWSPPTQLATLSLIQLDQSRFGEHYINLYWYREDAEAMAASVQETEEYRRLQHEFHNFTERDLESQRDTVDAAEYTSLVNRLRRLRVLRRLATARARRHAEGELGLVVDPNCPIRGFQLRVIDEAGTISEHYLPNDADKPTLSFTETGLQPNNMYVCRLCPHYGDNVWGCWTAPLKYMTHNLIQLDLTYISETFVDLEWWRLDNKEVTKMDVNDTLLSSRYTEEVQVYQLRIAHEDAETGEEVEEFRDMQAANVLRIDALLPDMKYTIAVREWDAKGDWGLWSAPCSCVTLPSIATVVTEVKECSAHVAWSRAAPRIDYESDMHVLEGNVEITGFYLRLEEIPVHTRAAAAAAAAESADGAAGRGGRVFSNPLDSADGSFSDSAESAGSLSMDIDDTQLIHTSFHGIPSVATDEKPRAAEVDELEGTLAFGFQRGGPLPPEQHPQLYDGLVPNSSSTTTTNASSRQRHHYLMVQKIASSTELQAALNDLSPQTIYCVQVMAETTGGQVGPWSAPHHFITMPRIRLSLAAIYEHYATLQWGRVALAPLATLVAHSGTTAATASPNANTTTTNSGGNAGGHRNSWSILEGTGRKVTLPTSKVVAYELEVCGLNSDFTLSTRLETAATTSNFRVTGLALDSLYTARVRSFNEAGEASLWSTERTFVTLKQLLVHPNEITENHIDLEWGRPEQYPETYRQKLAQRAEREELAGASSSLRSVSGAAGDAKGVSGAAAAGTNAASALPAAAVGTANGNTTSNTSNAVGRGVPAVSVGARDAVKYHVRVYHASEDAPPRLFLERHLNGNVVNLTVNSLAPNAIYLLYVRAVNHDGVWSEWSDCRCVYTMKPLVSSIATVGEDFVRLQWSREAPEEVHYAPNTGNNNNNNMSNETGMSATTRDRSSYGDGTTDGGSSHLGPDGSARPTELGEEDDDDEDGAAASALATAGDSPNASQQWQRRRRFVLQDKPSGDVGPVYRSAATTISAYVISVRRSEEAEGYTVEVPGTAHQHTLPSLQPDSIYLICVRAKYGSGEWSPWSDIVRTGTYNLLATDVKEVGEDYFAAAWQRKSNTIHMGSLHLGKVEETVCYEVRVRDYSEVPLGEEEGEAARQREQEGRSLFLHPNQRHCLMRELQSNHRYRLAVRRWYQPHDGFALVDGDATADGAAAGSLFSLPFPGSDNSSNNTSTAARVAIDPVLRESMEKAKAAPGVWSEAEYVVTLRGMVCTVERVGEEFFQLRWARDPRAVPLPVRRAMPVKPVQTYQLRIDEMLRDGSAVETTRGSSTLHLDELMPPTETTYFNKSLKPNTLYKIEVRCCIEKTWGRWSRPVYVITLPCLQVELNRIGEECATITWRRPREPLTLPDGEVAVLGDEEDADGTYQLEVSGVGFSYQVSKRFKASRSSYTVKHLDADALYSARVRWGDSVNQAWSLWSDTACFATLKPLQVRLSMPTEHFVNVEWSRPRQTAEEYVARIEKQQSGAAGAVVAATSANASPPQQQSAGADNTTTTTTAAAAGVDAAPAEAQPHAGGRNSLVSSLVATVQLGNPGSLAFHLCVFNTQETPSVAVVDKQFHKDASNYRVSGLNADTPYVVIIRACCEATGNWGLWSDERPFRTLKLLAPTVSGVGENYAELTWEQGEGAEAQLQQHQQQRGEEAGGASGHGEAAMPTKYLVVLRSTQFGTVEREITPEECGVTHDEGTHTAPVYRLTHLHPGTEYAVALQPCYGGTGDWGLWSHAVLFTTLHTLQLTATVRGETADLTWGRQNPPRAVEIADPLTDGQTADVAVGGNDYNAFAAPSAILLPTAGSASTGTAAAAAAAPLGSTRTVSRYQLVVYREADFVALRHQHASLEASISTALRSSSSLLPALGTASAKTGGAEAQLHSALTTPNASPLQDGHHDFAKLGPLSPPSGHGKGRSGHRAASKEQRSSADGGALAAPTTQTAIPDMDMAALVNLEAPGATSTNHSIFLFRKTYDLTETNAAPPAGSSKGGNSRANTGNMVEHIEGLTPDTIYIARLRAMDLFGNWGAFVEQRLITPPLPPSQVVLRRVNAQFCSLQWLPPATSSSSGATGAANQDNADGVPSSEANHHHNNNASNNNNNHNGGLGAEEGEGGPAAHYRYIIEQCFTATDAAAASSGGLGSGPNAASGAASGSAGAARRGGGGGGNAGSAGAGGASSSAGTGGPGAEWHVVDTVEDSTVCAVRISGLLNRMRCRVKCARRHITTATTIPTTGGALGSDDAVAATGDSVAAPLPANFLGPYSDYSEVVAVSSGTPPEGVQDLHLTTLSQNAATLEWLPPPKPSEAAAGRYTRPHYRVYLANTTDQPYPLLLTTVHRPTYALTNLTPGTAYTVQVVAENNDGVSFRNPIVLFHTKAEDDTTVSRHEETTAKGAAAAAPPLGEIVAFHGPRAVQQQLDEDGAFAGEDAVDDIADIPTASRRLPSGPTPPSPALQRGRGGRGGGSGAGKARGGRRDSQKAAADGTRRPSTSPQRKGSAKRNSSAGRARSTSVKEKAPKAAKGGAKRKKSGTTTANTPEPPSTTKPQGNRLPPLSKTV